MRTIILIIFAVCLAGTCISCSGEKPKEYTVLVTGEGTEFPLNVSTVLKDTIAIEKHAKLLLIRNGYPAATANTLKFKLN